MLRKIAIGAILFSLILIVVACTGPAPTTPTPNPTPSGPIKATWIEPQVNRDTVSIPASEVENNWNAHFKVETQDGNMTFMAYVVDGEIYVRANICPPCRSIGFSLQKSTLVCDTCGTIFDAKTGAGISGACVGYPKAAVAYKIDNGNIVMKSTDLTTAYQDTIEPGLP